MSGKQSQRLKVYLRQRPFATIDPALKSESIIDSITEKEITIKCKNQERKYKVDHVFGEEASQLDVYNTVITPYINDAISGYNCTVFAYGPTGTGKTYTIFGENLEFANSSTTNESFGIIPRVAKDLFIGLDKFFDIEYTVRISFVEIYNEEVRDLFLKHSVLRIFDDPTSKNATYFKGLREVTICTLDDFYDWLIIGQQELQKAATKNNLRSSRSHTIFTFSINTQKYTGGEQVLEAGKLQFVDLAGSEHTQRSGAVDISVKEVANINKSIFTLGKVIKALAQKQPHVPYRDCKVTRVLQDSLGGNAKTSMISTFLPTTQTLEETVATFETAAVARNIINSPRINITRKLNQVYLEEELARLRKDLTATQNKLGCCMTSDEYEKISEEIEAQDSSRMDLIDKIRGLEDFKQTMNDNYMNLMFSFKITKESLEEKKQELEKRSQVVQEQEQIVKHLEKHDVEATKAVDTVFKICETMLDDKMTYHEKYDKQQDITKRNADDAQLLINNSLNGLEKVKCGYHNYTEGLESRIVLQEEYINQIADRNKEILKINDNLCKKVLEKISCNGVELSDLLGSFADESNTDLSTKSFKNIQEHIQNKDGILCNLKENVLLNNQNKLDWDKALENVMHEQLSTKKNFFTNSYKQFDELSKNFEDANDLFVKKVEVDTQFYETAEQYFHQNEEFEQNFNEHTNSIGDKIENCSLLSTAYQNEAIKTRLKQLTDDYIASVQLSESNKEQVANDILKEINGTEANYFETISSHTKALELYNNEIKSTIERSVDASNQKYLEMFNDWFARTSTLENELNKNRDGLEKMRKEMEDLKEYNVVELEKNVDNLLLELREKTEELKNTINYAIHDGDTPAKRSLNYPKMPILILQQHDLSTLYDEPENSEDPQ